MPHEGEIIISLYLMQMATAVLLNIFMMMNLENERLNLHMKLKAMDTKKNYSVLRISL